MISYSADATVREFELNVAELEQNERLRMADVEVRSLEARRTGWMKVLIAVFKAPTLPLAVLAVLILTLKDKDVPAALEQFLSF